MLMTREPTQKYLIGYQTELNSYEFSYEMQLACAENANSNMNVNNINVTYKYMFIYSKYLYLVQSYEVKKQSQLNSNVYEHSTKCK